MTEEVKDLLKNLSAKERDVIILLFGLGGFPKSPEEIAQLYGVNKDTVLQIASEVLNKLSISKEELTKLAKKIAQSYPKVKRWKLSDADLFGDSSKLANKSSKILDEIDRMFKESNSKK